MTIRILPAAQPLWIDDGDRVIPSAQTYIQSVVRFADATFMHFTVTQKETGLTRQVTTNDRGFYVAPSLPVGTYTVAVEVKGFKRKSVTGITLQINEEPRIDVALEVGEVSETVTITSAAP